METVQSEPTGQTELQNWVKQEGSDFWNPTEKGEELVGDVVEIIQGDYGLQYVIKNTKGQRIKTPSHKVLQARMTEAVAGTCVKIVFTGVELPKQKGYKPTNLYEVFFRAK